MSVRVNTLSEAEIRSSRNGMLPDLSLSLKRTVLKSGIREEE